jgi:hypothetical protein
MLALNHSGHWPIPLTDTARYDRRSPRLPNCTARWLLCASCKRLSLAPAESPQPKRPVVLPSQCERRPTVACHVPAYLVQRYLPAVALDKATPLSVAPMAEDV